jgi:signal transduction histidine kinase
MNAVAASIKATAEAECPALVPEARNLSRISMAVMRVLRTTLRSLRPPEIDDFGLAASLAVLARDYEQLAGGGLKISLEISGDLGALPPTAASHVYRIVQEGLTNINKHAHGARARVDLGFRPEAADPNTSERRWLTLTIENEGRGAADRGMAAEGNGFGLIGMRERVTALGGQLDILDLGDRGFRLHAMIPFEVPARLAQ